MYIKNEKSLQVNLKAFKDFNIKSFLLNIPYGIFCSPDWTEFEPLSRAIEVFKRPECSLILGFDSPISANFATTEASAGFPSMCIFIGFDTVLIRFYLIILALNYRRALANKLQGAAMHSSLDFYRSFSIS